MTPQETEQLLDRTLHALANAEPAPGFTDRLEARLTQHRNQHSRTQRNFAQRRLRLPSLHVALPLTLTATLLCAVALFYPHSNLSNSKAQTQPNTPNLAASALQPQQSQIPTASRPTATNTRSKLEISRLTAQPKPTPSFPTAKLRVSVSSADPAANATLDPDQQALVDFNTPSYPAPPLPSTEQERLVRLMLRQGEKRDLAELESARIDATFRRERSEFSTFFDPPPPPREPLTKQLDAEPAPTSASPASLNDSTKPQPSSPQPQNSGDPQ